MTLKLLIDGMSCKHCVRRIKEALQEMAQVRYVEVDLEDKSAIVKLEKQVEQDKFRAAVEQAGYVLVGIEKIRD